MWNEHQKKAFGIAQKADLSFEDEHPLNDVIESAVRFVIYTALYESAKDCTDTRSHAEVVQEAVEAYLREKLPNTLVTVTAK